MRLAKALVRQVLLVTPRPGMAFLPELVSGSGARVFHLRGFGIFGRFFFYLKIGKQPSFLGRLGKIAWRPILNRRQSRRDRPAWSETVEQPSHFLAPGSAEDVLRAGLGVLLAQAPIGFDVAAVEAFVREFTPAAQLHVLRCLNR
jgi:hypothetical protein